MSGSELERRLAEQQEVLELGLELAQTLEPERVMALALEKAERFSAAETSSIWELDESRGELFFRLVRGQAAVEIRHLRIPLGEGIVGDVAASGRAERIEDAARDPRWHGEVSDHFSTRSMLVVPLVSRGRVIGVLQLLNSTDGSAFDEDDLRRMELFAGPLAHALANARLYASLERTFVESGTALAEAVERRDPYTGGHLRRVVAYSLLLGRELGLEPAALEEIRLGATLHDIGKIAVPDAILGKPAALTPEEVEVMRRHPVDGAEIVGRIGSLGPVLPIVRSHHERIDGRGYPDGLAGDEIPLAVRIVAVADTYDAITTSRPYRPGLSPERAAEEIAGDAGTRLCPRVAAAFAALHGSNRFDLAVGERLAGSLSLRRGGEYNAR